MAEDQDISVPDESSLKTPGSMLLGITDAIQKLVPLYERIKIAGILVVTGVALGLLTVVLPLFAGWLPGTKFNLGEEIVIGALAFLFVALGVFFQTIYNGMQTRLALETLKIGGERNVLVHEETMAKLRLPPSSEPAPTTPGTQYGLSTG